MAVPRKLLSVSLVFSALACAADPALLNLVMPEARIFAGVNVERILASPIGKQLDSKIQDGAPQLQQILNATGFDLRRDLKEILIAATGQGQNGPSLILVRGSFDAAKLGSFLSGSGQKTIHYEGVEILANPAQKSGSLAILDNNIAVGGELDQVRAAIQRRKRGTVLPAEVVGRIAALSERYDIWFQSTGPVMAPDAKISDAKFQQAGDLLKTIQQVSGGVKFSAGVDLAAEVVTHNEKEAASVLGALQLLTGFLTMNQQGPNALKPDALKLTAEGKTVRLALSITEEQIQQAYAAQQARLKQGADPTFSAPQPRPADTGLVIQGSGSDMGTVHLPPSN
ncbi:MAG: DUF3352 domain-containing protein [Acidobacteriia bacterium]|nr:DUF3352 domain-containing protein [Terriglobia bacterium]